MTLYKFPLTGVPKTFGVTLPSGTYRFRLVYCNAANGNGGWALDILDSGNNPLVCGIPLVTGADLLEQYAYLGLGGTLFVATSGDAAAVPTFEDLGTTSNLYFET